MKLLQITTAILVAPAAIFSAPALAQTNSYRVEANSTQTIDMNICNPEVRVSVRGDGDTDLDFRIMNARGDVVHSDYDLTDITFATVNRRSDVVCETFQLEVRNLGNVWNGYEVALETITADGRGSGGGSGDGYNREVGIRNWTKESLFYIYWSNVGVGGWGDDKLGSSVLATQQQWNVTVDDGSGACRFDFKAVTASGREIVLNDVDVCSVALVTFE